MSLKRSYLIILLFILLFIFLSEYALKLILFVVFLWFLKNKKARIYLFCIFIYLSLSGNILNPPERYSGRIVFQNTTSAIVDTGKERVLVFGLDRICLGCELKFEGEYKKIKEELSTYSFSFADYYQRQDIYYQINVKNIEYFKEDNIQQQFYEFISLQENSKFILSMLLKFNDEIFSSKFINAIIFSKGLLISTVSYFIYFFGKRFFYLKTIFYIQLFIISILSMFYGSYLVLWRFLLLRCLKDRDYIEKFLLSTIVLLLINQYYIYNLAFLIPQAFLLKKCFSSRNKLLDSILVLAPLNLYYFYSLNFFNIIFFKFYKNMVFLGFIISILSLIAPLSNVLNLYIFLIEHISIFNFEITGKPSLVWIFIWIEISSCYLITRKYRYLFILIQLLIINQYKLLFNPFNQVTFLYIGQGDCTIVQRAFSFDITVIDTGSGRNYRYLNDYLKAKGIFKVTHLVITHNDEDHAGNLENLLNDYKVENLILNAQDFFIEDVQVFSLLKDRSSNDKNELSLVNYFNLDGLNYLLLGDVSKEIEREILYQYNLLNPQIIKLGHHGSKTSSSFELLSLNEIQLAVISSGLNNIYGHPDSQVLKSLLAYKIPFLNTAEVGDIKIISNSFFRLLFTSSQYGRTYLNFLR